jgi:hypothetical protein
MSAKIVAGFAQIPLCTFEGTDSFMDIGAGRRHRFGHSCRGWRSDGG